MFLVTHGIQAQKGIRYLPILWIFALALTGCVAPQGTPADLTTVTPADLPLPGPSPTVMSFSTVETTPSPVAAVEGVRHYPSLNQVSALAFDGRGALWAGTTMGPVRWDLETETPALFTFDDCASQPSACGPRTHWVHDITVATTVSGEPVIWAATTGGVRRFEGGAWITYTPEDGLPDILALAVATAPDGSLWAATGNGLAHFADGVWTPHVSMAGVEGGTVWAISVSPDGDVWASTHGGGVVQYDPGSDTWRRFSTEAGFPYPNARALATGPDGLPWVYIGYGNVYRFSGDTWQVAYTAEGGQWVCDLAFGPASAPYTQLDATHPLIATCDGYHTYGVGLAYRTTGGWQTITTEDGLPTNDIAAVAVGPSGELAVGTDRGVSIYQDGAWRTLREGPTLSAVTSVAVTPDGTAWFGFGDAASMAAGGGLAGFDGQTWSYTSIDGLGVDANVRALAVAPDGTLWAGAGCTVTHLVQGSWATVATCDTLSGNVNRIAFGPGGEIWVATDFNVYRVEGNDMVAYEHLIPVALAIGPTGTPWVARSAIAGGGLLSFDGSAWISHTLPISSPTAIAITPQNEVWAAADGSLTHLNGEDWSVEANVMPDLIRLIVGPAGDLWAVGSEGISHLSDQGWERVVDLGVPIYDLAFTPEGHLWLATDVGAIAYVP